VLGRTARVDRPLTYLVPTALELALGDVVRVPLGPREVYGYVVGAPHAVPGDSRLRPVAAKYPGERAFDASSLALARWIAERYCCSLGEALGAIVFAPALPRVVDRFRVAIAASATKPQASVPPRLLRLVEGELAEGFTLEALLRHPEARRAGDRRTLLTALNALTRSGAVLRERTFVQPRVGEATETLLEVTGVPIVGHRARALVAAVAEVDGLRRSDALLAGFSHALVARAVKTGALRERVRPKPARTIPALRNGTPFVPTAEQRNAIDAIVACIEVGRFDEILVHGVTGSGKTFVYLQAIARVLERGHRAIVLVPEIALTPQTARRFGEFFGERVAVLHSALSERERYDAWQAAARGSVGVVVGARSAVFAPLPDVRLIVIDEAHERSYKQDGVPRYDTLAVARERMRLADGVLVLGSATPPLEAEAAARAGRLTRVRLDARASAQPLPTVRVVDLAAEFERGNRRIFGSQLVEALAARLERGEKSVLFVNRRGSASFVLCRACGAVPECGRCSISLALHRAENVMRCHLCDAQAPVPLACAGCGSGPIREFGAGTQKVVEAVEELFPAARVVRVDSDTTTHVGDHARLLDEFAERGDVLVGTQMIAKGLDFPSVTLACVVAADVGLHAPDFRAAERSFDLIAQVTGRSGRARPGEAIVQTYAPNHPAIEYAGRHDFDGFATRELEHRRELRYPPFAELIYVAIAGRNRAATSGAAERYAALLRAFDAAEVLGPAPETIARVDGEWRYRIALKASDGARIRAYVRETLREVAARDRGVRLAVNVDP